MHAQCGAGGLEVGLCVEECQATPGCWLVQVAAAAKAVTPIRHRLYRSCPDTCLMLPLRLALPPYAALL